MTRPPPLTRAEMERLWRWERGMRRFYIAAMVILAVAGMLAVTYSDEVYLRRGVLALVAALVIAASILQLRERCPRCGARLSFKSSLTLPARCGKCGAVFERAPANP
jgi:hypothetical protein